MTVENHRGKIYARSSSAHATAGELLFSMPNDVISLSTTAIAASSRGRRKETVHKDSGQLMCRAWDCRSWSILILLWSSVAFQKRCPLWNLRVSKLKMSLKPMNPKIISKKPKQTRDPFFSYPKYMFHRSLNPSVRIQVATPSAWPPAELESVELPKPARLCWLIE